MATPDEIKRSIKAVLESELAESDSPFPSNTIVITEQADATGVHADLPLPLVEVTVRETVRAEPHNTSWMGYATDSNGNHIGYIYHYKYDIALSFRVFTADGSSYDPDVLGRFLQRGLRQYDYSEYDAPLPDPSNTSQPLKGAVRLELEGGSPDDDLSTAPALRRWSQDFTVHAYDELNTAEEYGPEDFVRTVKIPGDGDFSSDPSTDGAVIEYTPTT